MLTVSLITRDFIVSKIDSTVSALAMDYRIPFLTMILEEGVLVFPHGEKEFTLNSDELLYIQCKIVEVINSIQKVCLHSITEHDVSGYGSEEMMFAYVSRFTVNKNFNRFFETKLDSNFEHQLAFTVAKMKREWVKELCSRLITLEECYTKEAIERQELGWL